MVRLLIVLSVLAVVRRACAEREGEQGRIAWAALVLEARLEREKKNLEKARGLILEAAKIAKTLKDSRKSARTYYLLGIVELELGEFAAAVVHMHKALELLASAGGSVDKDISVVRADYLRALVALGDYKTALAVSEKLAEGMEGQERVARASMQTNVATIQISLGRYDNAKRSLQRAERLLQGAKGESARLARAHLLSARAGLDSDHYDYDRALRKQRAVYAALAEAPTAGGALGRCLLNTGEVLMRRGQLEAALVEFEHGLRLTGSEPADSPIATRALSRYSLCLLTLGKVKKSEVALGRARKMSENLPRVHPSRALLLISAGQHRLRENRIDAARRDFARALTMWRSIAPLRGVKVVEALERLAEVELNAGSLHRYRDLLLESLRIRESLVGPDHRSLVAPLRRLEKALSMLGKSEDAARIGKRLAAIVSKSRMGGR